MENITSDKFYKISEEFFKIINFIGVPTLSLVLLSLIFIMLLNLCSPLEKIANYFLGIVCGALLTSFMNLSFLTMLRYLLIMFVPYIIANGVYFALRFLKWFFSSDNSLQSPKPVNPYYAIDSTRRDPINKKKN